MRGIRLFRLFGIDVYLSWWWFLIAVYQLQSAQATNGSSRRYSSLLWYVAEYLTLFLFVLLHEFGHALACKSVGGKAEKIMLWPLGGVAYVSPPLRPGATLWSIVAGPLVNVALAPILFALITLTSHGIIPASPDLKAYFLYIFMIDVGLLIFNMLPIYPLDGGKIVWSLLWFVMGRGKSLMVSCVIGLIAGTVGMILAAINEEKWFIVISFYAIFRSWTGLQMARKINAVTRMPRWENFTCPSCRESPPMAPLWKCQCGATFDTFATHATCPQCSRQFATTLCPYCGVSSPFNLWYWAQSAPMPVPAVMAAPPLVEPPPLPVPPPMRATPPWP